MKNFTFSFLIISTLILSACSGGQKASTKLEINVYGIDQMKYVVKEKADYLKTGTEYQVNGETYYLLTGINATAGENIKLTLNTISKIPPSAMSHNWLLLKLDADAEAFALESSGSAENDYIATSMKDQVIIETGMVGGGKSATINFSAPNTAGDYNYLCTFPGHFTGGMKGLLSVQDNSDQ